MVEIQRAQQWLTSLLELMKFPAAVSDGSSTQTTENSIWLIVNEGQLTPEQIKMLIGERGSNIDAMQYLINTLLNIGVEAGSQQSYTIEIDGYRQRRQTELYALAEQAALQAQQTGEEVEMKSLSSAERRQIHSFLEQVEGITTESRGQEPDRRLIVKLSSS